MFKAEQAKDSNAIKEAIEQKIKELTDLVALQEYGCDGPPKDLTWRQIETLGHGTGQTIAQRVAAAIQEEHAEHFQGQQPCPQCGQACCTNERVERHLETLDGRVRIDELQYHCNACRRSFFPSENCVED